MLGSQKLDANASQKVVYNVNVPHDDTVRFVFLYVDADNYYCIQWDRSASLFSIIRRVAAAETVVHTLVSADYADDPLNVKMTICFHDCELRAEFHVLEWSVLRQLRSVWFSISRLWEWRQMSD